MSTETPGHLEFSYENPTSAIIEHQEVIVKALASVIREKWRLKISRQDIIVENISMNDFEFVFQLHDTPSNKKLIRKLIKKISRLRTKDAFCGVDGVLTKQLRDREIDLQPMAFHHGTFEQM